MHTSNKQRQIPLNIFPRSNPGLRINVSDNVFASMNWVFITVIKWSDKLGRKGENFCYDSN